MYRNKFLAALVVLTALVIACGRQPAAPTSPSSASAVDAHVDDPVTLKASAPRVVSPVNDVKLETQTPAFVIERATATYDPTAVFEYRFQLLNDAGAVIDDSGALYDTTTYTVPASVSLDFEKRYTWRARAESNRALGPWTTALASNPIASFVTPAGAYIRGNELRDPLTNGLTVGRAVNSTFIPGQGIRLDGRESYVEYQLQEPLIEGEFSALLTNVGNGSEDWKTKVMSMLQGDGVNITDNAYRVTLDKRTLWLNQGAPARYTMRSRGTDSGEPNAGPQSWDRSKLYLWRFTWSGGQSRMQIREGGVNGFVKVDIGVAYRGPYAPNPHLVRLGSVFGRGGSDTNPGTIVRNVWVSSKSRPVFSGDTP
jgi:hypothetical protein